MKRKIIAVSLAVAGTIMLTGCGTHSVSTAPDQVGLHYLGGPFSAHKYNSYVPPSTKKWFGPGDNEYLYPAGQRTYDATGGKDSERNAITSVSQDSVEMSTKISVTFNLKTDEETLRKFHEKVGIKYKAYMDGDSTSAGWRRLLEFYLGQSIETTLDREVANYKWRDLYNKPEIRVALQDAVNKDLPTLVQSKIGDEYFDSFSAQVQKPDVTNEALKQSIADVNNNIAQAQAQKAKAEADLATARAQIAVSQAEAAKKAAEIRGYGNVDNYNKHECIMQGCNPYQPTFIYGAPQPQASPK